MASRKKDGDKEFQWEFILKKRHRAPDMYLVMGVLPVSITSGPCLSLSGPHPAKPIPLLSRHPFTRWVHEEGSPKANSPHANNKMLTDGQFIKHFPSVLFGS